MERGAVCGIVGWLGYERDMRAQAGVVHRMTATMACRGPDDAGTWLGQHCALGHRRLAIIDLPGGKQPMTTVTADGSVTLVYSGECYNYAQLRAELRSRGHQFHTDSDTEAVLLGYLEWGADVMDRLNGMYAFAIWDERDEHLLLARDRMGVKPLYYYPTEDGLLFGSEPKAILANPAAERVVDLDGLREMFGYVKTPGQAVWRGMLEVQPGTVVIADRSGCQSSVYWRLSARPHVDDVPTTVARVRELLDDIVTRQLVADVPLCMLLSGGLDSSALTAVAAGRVRAAGSGLLRSFAVDFVGQVKNFMPDELRDTPDGPYVHEVASHTRVDHRDIMLDPAALADPAVRRAAVTARDIPLGLGEMDNSLYLLFDAIRAHSTVALSGEAADEVFGGYRWFHDPTVQQADTFPWIASHLLIRGVMLDPEAAKVLDLDRYIEQRYQEAVAEVPELDGLTDLERRMRRISYLHLTRFLRTLLDRKDRMSMAVGLEVRVPFCDHRLVDYVFNTPWAYKVFDGREKSLLRAAVADTLPQSVLQRAKAPYPTTQDPRYLVELQRQAADVLHSDNGALALFDRSGLAKVTAADPNAVGTQERFALERLLDTAIWYDTFRPTLQF
jgi:asparagine synthase (glutamine-hydrolysing)